MSVQKVVLCPFHSREPPSGVTLESAGLENIPQIPGNRAEVGQNYDGRKAVSASLSVLKSSRAMLRPRSSKVSVQKVVRSPFHCKLRIPGVSLESPAPDNIPHLPESRAKAGQNHDARKAVPVTL